MELINATKMQAGYTMGMNPDGRESLVVVVKGTFQIPSYPDETPPLAAKQAPLVDADIFTGEPGLSATVYECDYPPFKPRCDVLLNGSAYGPKGRHVERVTVSMRVGDMSKSFDVVGERRWRSSMAGAYITKIKQFVRMPFSYDNAYGGKDESFDNPDKHKYFLANPFGVGFQVNTAKEAIHDKPLPNTEETGRPVNSLVGKYRPMSFGPIARSWAPRPKYAGTYDDQWFENTFPFLPADFDERYFQAAPEDQQVDYLQGGEEVELRNLTPKGDCRFRVPEVSVPVEFMLRDYRSEKKRTVIDTLMIEPDLMRFTLCWRTSIPLKKNIFEVPMCVVGRMPKGWYRARALGKSYYSNLRELSADRS